MKKYRYGNNSITILDTVNRYLRMAAYATIEESVIDISIPEWGGIRSTEYQFSLYKKEWSRADGTTIKSKHQLKDDEDKSRALDLCVYFKGEQSWNKARLTYIAVLFNKNFERLKKEGKIPQDVYLHSGMFWQPSKSDPDGMGFDLPHHHISNKPQTKIFV